MSTASTSSRIIPCLWLDDQAEAAGAAYAALFGGRVTATSRYPEAFDNPGGKPRGSVLTVEVEVAGVPLTLLNGGPQFHINPAISLFAHASSPAEADRWFAALADGGEVLMPIDTYPWSERYGWVQDRFGMSWQVISGARPAGAATLVPSLLFANDVRGRAAEALRHYAAIFPGGRVDALEPYPPGAGPADMIAHGRAILDGQALNATDSHIPHAFAFDEGLSLQVMCADQAEVDHYWDALGAGGSHGPCGWLKDRFGVSWQVVPRSMTAWMNHPDAAARDRAFAAMLTMSKLDVAALEAALAGR